MNPGVVKCPVCANPVRLLVRTGQMNNHYSDRGRPGGGFRTLPQKCRGSYRKPEDLEGLK